MQFIIHVTARAETLEEREELTTTCHRMNAERIITRPAPTGGHWVNAQFENVIGLTEFREAFGGEVALLDEESAQLWWEATEADAAGR